MAGMTDLEICKLAFEGNAEALKNKIKANFSLSTKSDQSGRQAIHWAACGGHADIVDFLITQCEADANARDEPNWTPLMIAISAGKEQVVRTLIAKGAQVNAINCTGQCCLHYAASKDRFQLAELLLENGADVNVADNCNNVPLHRATSKGHTKLTKLLLSYGADFNYQEKEGNTPLHFACEDEQTDDAKLLVQHGASITIRNKDERSPLDYTKPGLKKQLQRLAENFDPNS